MVQNFISGGGAVNQLAEAADADLRVYELDLDRPTRDFTTGPAMTEEGCARAMAYGMMAVEQGLHVICLGEMGIANTTSAAALCTALFGGEPSDWVGPGTGVDAKGMGRKAEMIAAGSGANPGALNDPLEALRCLGGFELAAIAGAVIAARLARTPVVLDGYACTAAAAVWRSSTLGRSTIASSPTARPSRAMPACWRSWASSRCSTSACGWARGPGRPWRFRS